MSTTSYGDMNLCMALTPPFCLDGAESRARLRRQPVKAAPV